MINTAFCLLLSPSVFSLTLLLPSSPSYLLYTLHFLCSFFEQNPDNFLLQKSNSDKNPQNTRTHRFPLYPGPGRGGSRLSRDAQTSLSPDTSSSSSGWSPRRSQASRET
ncbi:hypothetical protein XENORESO_019751 [Xenotaenia resolanae]|uniref:Secreted protein n=1 Tax=Xenotaenia resolanae TaxID=208358 RepID=A0ABV0X3G9_9TELE